jgi:hypothetical protein
MFFHHRFNPRSSHLLLRELIENLKSCHRNPNSIWVEANFYVVDRQEAYVLYVVDRQEAYVLYVIAFLYTITNI